jgi:hypothetical protein
MKKPGALCCRAKTILSKAVLRLRHSPGHFQPLFLFKVRYVLLHRLQHILCALIQKVRCFVFRIGHRFGAQFFFHEYHCRRACCRSTLTFFYQAFLFSLKCGTAYKFGSVLFLVKIAHLTGVHKNQRGKTAYAFLQALDIVEVFFDFVVKINDFNDLIQCAFFAFHFVRISSVNRAGKGRFPALLLSIRRCSLRR